MILLVHKFLINIYNHNLESSMNNEKLIIDYRLKNKNKSFFFAMNKMLKYLKFLSIKIENV